MRSAGWAFLETSPGTRFSQRFLRSARSSTANPRFYAKAKQVRVSHCGNDGCATLHANALERTAASVTEEEHRIFGFSWNISTKNNTTPCFITLKRNLMERFNFHGREGVSSPIELNIKRKRLIKFST